jgi:hypothetical protein
VADVTIEAEVDRILGLYRLRRPGIMDGVWSVVAPVEPHPQWSVVGGSPVPELRALGADWTSIGRDLTVVLRRAAPGQ